MSPTEETALDILKQLRTILEAPGGASILAVAKDLMDENARLRKARNAWHTLHDEAVSRAGLLSTYLFQEHPGRVKAGNFATMEAMRILKELSEELNVLRGAEERKVLVAERNKRAQDILDEALSLSEVGAHEAIVMARRALDGIESYHGRPPVHHAKPCTIMDTRLATISPPPGHRMVVSKVKGNLVVDAVPIP